MKIPKPRKLKSGNWNIQLRLNGNSISITKNTARECERKALLLKAEYKNGKIIRQSDEIILYDAIGRYVNENEGVLSESTLRSYESIRRNRLQEVMYDTIGEDFNWQKAISNEAKNGLSPKTIKNIWGLVGKVLRYNGMTVPQISLPQQVRHETEWLDAHEIKIFVNSIYGKKVEVPALLALHSLRRSEIMALRNEDIDLKRNLIYVRGAVVADRNNKFIRKATNKTDSSARTIPIMIPRLAQLVKSEGGVFIKYSPDALRIAIKRACADAGLHEVSTHGLRHSFASLCCSLGISTKQCQLWGGWANERTVMNIYTHVSERQSNESALRVQNFFESD